MPGELDALRRESIEDADGDPLPSGYDRYGYDAEGYNRDGYDADGYDPDGCDREGYDRDGYDGEGVPRHETIEEDPAPLLVGAVEPLRLADASVRPSRLLSFEQEVVGNPDAMVYALWADGLSASDGIVGYHDGDSYLRRGRSADGSVPLCVVEADGSVSAEVIWSKLDLSDDATASRFAHGLEVVRSHVGERGGVRLNSQCGLHVHVGIQGYGRESVESLYHLWCSVEDIMYRLASAKWRGHRSEFAGHDYSPKAPKGYVKRSDIGRSFLHSRGALNLSPYLNSARECGCGAFTFGEWEECTCRLSRPTVEFRVYNGSANPVKFRAYGALSSALVALAERERFRHGDLPVCDWRGTEYGRAESLRDQWGRIMALPLTDAERDAVRYCAEHSSASVVLQ